MLSIGQMSLRTGVKIPTIRYYEQMGLINAPLRSSGNQRRYSKDELERLSFIKHARDLGLPIEAIAELLQLSSQPEQPCEDADKIAKQHLEVISERIRKLKKLEKELKRISSNCNGENIKECYVIRALVDHKLCNEEH